MGPIASTGLKPGRDADWKAPSAPSPMEALLTLISSGNVLSFALGLPASELFPRELVSEAATRVLESNQALQYGSPQARLKEHIAGMMSDRGYPCSPDRILVTTGAQQALALIVRLLLGEGGSVVTEELVYPTFIQVLKPYKASFMTVPSDLRTGIDVEALEERLAQGVHGAFLYAIADGHNPLGVSISPSKRRRLAQIARQYRLPVIEDDAYGFLCYDGKREPPLSAYDPDGMFYVGSFSKILGPSLRVGWLVVPERFLRILSTLKEAADINTASLSQRIVCECLERMDLGAHISGLVEEYRRRRDCMLDAIRRHFPPGTTCITPSCGFFVWASLNVDIDTQALCMRAIEEERIAFVPGASFAVGEHAVARSCLRLNFSNCSPAKIEDGIKRLGSVTMRMLQSSRRSE